MSITRSILLLGSLTIPTTGFGHDPVFGLGPHVLFKGGIEIAPEFYFGRAGGVAGIEISYGITGDWAAGITLPYVRQRATGSAESGQGDAVLFTKYRFWRDDAPGVQQSMSLAYRLKTNTGDDAVGTGSTDHVFGLAYGYESRKWYRWAALRYRINNRNDAGLQRGNRMLVDLVGGYRPTLSGYREPDTVWLLELNGELTQRAELNGNTLANSGGDQWFVSPGIFWTLRNFAIKAGVQIPLVNQLNGNQSDTDYRAKLVLEWHF